MRSFILTLSDLFPTSAATAFEPSCTLPTKVVNIAYSGNIRGTFEILWSCISTLLICTWTIQHLTIPEQAPKCKSWRDYGKRRGSEIWRTMKWFIITLLIPEVIAGKELQDLVMARKSFRDMKAYAVDDEVEWSLIQAYYANLGGFVLELHDCEVSAKEIPQTSEGYIQTQQETSQQALSADLMVGAETIFGTQIQGWDAISSTPKFIFSEKPQISHRKNPPNQCPNNMLSTIRLHLNADHVLALRTHKILPRLPSFPTESILDKSKGDPFVKSVAVLQMLWISIQSLIRASRHLQISHLEIATVAFSMNAFFTYACSFNKPQAIHEPTYISIQTNASESFLKRVHAITNEFSGYSGRRVSSAYCIGPPNVNMLHPIPNDVEYEVFPTVRGRKLPFTYYFVGMTISGIIFGLVHSLAWNFYFPSSTEKLLWRVCTVFTIAWTPLYILNYLLYLGLKRKGRVVFHIAISVEVIMFLGYVGARACLLALVFRFLFSLEPEAFVTTLDGLIPHFY